MYILISLRFVLITNNMFQVGKAMVTAVRMWMNVWPIMGAAPPLPWCNAWTPWALSTVVPALQVWEVEKRFVIVTVILLWIMYKKYQDVHHVHSQEVRACLRLCVTSLFCLICSMSGYLNVILKKLGSRSVLKLETYICNFVEVCLSCFSTENFQELCC